MRRTKQRRIRGYIEEFGAEEFFERAKIVYDYPDRSRVWIVHCHNRSEESMPKPNGVTGLDWKKFTASDVAARTEFSREEVIKRIRGRKWAQGKRAQRGKRIRRGDSDDSGAGDGGGAGDTGVNPIPAEELDADLDQGTTRKTVRKLDQGAVDAIREVTGADSDAEAVREAVALARDALIED